MAFILVAFEVTRPRSLVTTAAHFSMLHVLTGVRSQRAHRLPSFLFISSNERNWTLLNAALHRTRAVAAARDSGRSVLAMESAARAYTLCTAVTTWVQMAGLERVSCSMPAMIRVCRLVLGVPSVCATDTAVWGAVRTRRGVRKLEFVKVTTSYPPRAGPRPEAGEDLVVTHLCAVLYTLYTLYPLV